MPASSIIAENLKIERETKQLLEAAEAAERSFDESWDVLQTQVRALLDSDTVTSEVLNDIKQRLQRLGERAEEIEEELKRADEAPPPST
jgi:prefoldin subunit 5